MAKILWALVFWCDTNETSIVELLDIKKSAPKGENIRVGWRGVLSWVDESGQTTLYKAKILKISKSKDCLESLDSDNCGKIIKKKFLPTIMSEKKTLSTLKKQKNSSVKKNMKKLNFQVLGLKPLAVDIFEQESSKQKVENQPLIEDQQQHDNETIASSPTINIDAKSN
ncbi:hypothetical protein PV327_011051 [Microctonus hyperodae]|uniref:Uncharacterized protein n=1 Tax=Microctonus hyperodae TaxID=165561 RepID=A0AA39EXS6_MICHY|nr:hypothetical protein PV327_011051 [Microctonus hyperodae]